MLLSGRVAVVTGAASGIGEATARRLAEEGASVVLADINDAAAEAVVAGIRESGGTALFVHTDVALEAQIEAMMAATVGEFGRVDILHNNAADLSPALFTRDRTIDVMDADTWDRTFTVNLRGQMLCAKYAVPHMVRVGGGSIINMSSTSSLVGDEVRLAYAAAKSAVNSMTRSIAVSHGKRGVRCNAIAAGFVLTPPAREQVPPWLLQTYADNSLLTELGTPEAIADVVLFLASDQSRLITGQVINVDGGSLAHAPTLAAVRAHFSDSASEENHAD
jgi:NAD(P)-dependent dehydrogenase (short-subunit alcohol dehydrogenase family)